MPNRRGYAASLPGPTGRNKIAQAAGRRMATAGLRCGSPTRSALKARNNRCKHNRLSRPFRAAAARSGIQAPGLAPWALLFRPFRPEQTERSRCPPLPVARPVRPRPRKERAFCFTVLLSSVKHNASRHCPRRISTLKMRGCPARSRRSHDSAVRRFCWEVFHTVLRIY